VDRLLTVKSWKSPLVWVAAAMVLSLVLVHVPGVGREANGAKRWISIGPIGLQPSEIAKWVMPLLVAWYAVARRDSLREFKKGFLLPLAVVSSICGLIAFEDLGTAVLIESVAIAMLLAAGTRWQYVAALAPLGLLAFVGLVITSPYRVNRILAYLNPYADSQGIGYHIIQSMDAIRGGGLAGRGLGNSVQKFGYLPEGTTDFIYSIISEELGILGAGTVVALYAILVLCGAAIVTSRARVPSDVNGIASTPLLSNGSQLLGLGIVLTVGLQAFVNIAVVTGLAPTKGIALPLMSRGGTGWILTGLSLGFLVAMERAADRRRRELCVPLPNGDAPEVRHALPA
jgi:cell division protein FtsW